MKRLAVTMMAVLAGCGSGGGDSAADAASGGGDAGGDTVEVVIATGMGNMVVELETALMPITSANFLAYVDSGWYDGTLIHRVVDDWVIQGGGYTTGLTAKTANDPIVLETSAMVTHQHGAISMARTSDPDSATSQWFIVDWPESGNPPQPSQLDGNYAAFGRVIEGLDVLAAITQVSVGPQGALDDVPDSEIVVSSISRRSNQ